MLLYISTFETFFGDLFLALFEVGVIMDSADRDRIHLTACSTKFCQNLLRNFSGLIYGYVLLASYVFVQRMQKASVQVSV